MNILIAFIKKEIRQIRRDKRILPILIVAPLLQLIILGYAATFDIKNISLAICDLDNSDTSRDLIGSFTSSSYFKIFKHVNRPDDVDKLFNSNHINAALIIPYEFQKKIISRQKNQILFIVDGSEGTSANVALMYARNIIKSFEIKNSLTESRIIPEIDYRIRVWYNQELKSSFFMVPAIFALLLSIVTMLIPSMAIVKEKEMGTIEQLYVTPIKSYQMILGKMITFFIIGIVDVCLVTLVAIYHFGVPFRGSVFDFGISILLFFLSTLGIALFFSTNTKTQQQAMMSVIFMFFLPSMLLSGFIFPIENIPQPIRLISYCLPLTYFVDILRSLFLKGSSITELSHQYIMLGLIGVVIITFSFMRFKKYTS